MNELYYCGYRLKEDLGLCKIFDDLQANDDVIIFAHGRNTLIHEEEYINSYNCDRKDTGKTHIGFEYHYINFYYKGMIYHVEPSSVDVMVGSDYYYVPYNLVDGWYQNQAGYPAAFKDINSLDGKYKKLQSKIDLHISRSIPFYVQKRDFEAILNKKGGFREKDIYAQPHICYGLDKEGEVQPSVIRCEKLERDEDGVRRYFDIDLKRGEII